MVAEKTKAKPKATKPAAPKAVKEASVQKTAAAEDVTKVMDTRNGLQKRREVEGTVVSDKMTKTIVVKVDRRVRHSFYKKYTVKSRHYKAHDEKNEAKVGDQVTLVESRPLSRDKRWVLCKIIRRAGQTPATSEINV